MGFGNEPCLCTNGRDSCCLPCSAWPSANCQPLATPALLSASPIAPSNNRTRWASTVLWSKPDHSATRMEDGGWRWPPTQIRTERLLVSSRRREVAKAAASDARRDVRPTTRCSEGLSISTCKAGWNPTPSQQLKATPLATGSSSEKEKERNCVNPRGCPSQK